MGVVRRDRCIARRGGLVSRSALFMADGSIDPQIPDAQVTTPNQHQQPLHDRLHAIKERERGRRVQGPDGGGGKGAAAGAFFICGGKLPGGVLARCGGSGGVGGGVGV